MPQADDVKTAVNEEKSDCLVQLVEVISAYQEGKIKKIPEAIEQLFSNPTTRKEIATLRSEHLFEEGLVPKGYNGLPDKLLNHNFHQEGYITGLHVGYMLAMMALVDNGAILSVRGSIRPNLFGHSYDNCDEFASLYKDEKYRWIETHKSEEK